MLSPVYLVPFRPVSNPLFNVFCRLILTTVLVTAKMFNDTYYTNACIAQVGGVTSSNINELERYFMAMIDWRVSITGEEFSLYEASLASFYQKEMNAARAQQTVIGGTAPGRHQMSMPQYQYPAQQMPGMSLE